MLPQPTPEEIKELDALYKKTYAGHWDELREKVAILRAAVMVELKNKRRNND